MPYVNIKITREGATNEQKAALIRGATDLLVDVLGKNPATTVVVVDEVDTDNWGVAGEQITLRRRREAALACRRWRPERVSQPRSGPTPPCAACNARSQAQVGCRPAQPGAAV